MKKTLTVLMMVLLSAMLIISCDNRTSEPKTETPTTTPSEPTPTPTPLKKTYTVTFSTGEGGSKVDSQEVAKNGTVEKPSDPTRTGYDFVRWSATENGEKAFDFTNTKITADITIYAVWAKVYKVGDEGPAGGIIFYDCDADNDVEYKAEDGEPMKNKDGLKSSDCGWRYLEAAPADLTTTYTWGPLNSSYSTEEGIGKGKSNAEIFEDNGIDNFPAAKACADYGNGTTYDDWFLPSKDELNLMYTNLKLQGKGGNWQDSSYWSSSEDTDDYEDEGCSYAYGQFFNDGAPVSNKRSGGKYVRPVRAFQ